MRACRAAGVSCTRPASMHRADAAEQRRAADQPIQAGPSCAGRMGARRPAYPDAAKPPSLCVCVPPACIHKQSRNRHAQALCAHMLRTGLSAWLPVNAEPLWRPARARVNGACAGTWQHQELCQRSTSTLRGPSATVRESYAPHHSQHTGLGYSAAPCPAPQFFKPTDPIPVCSTTLGCAGRPPPRPHSTQKGVLCAP